MNVLDVIEKHHKEPLKCNGNMICALYEHFPEFAKFILKNKNIKTYEVIQLNHSDDFGVVGVTTDKHVFGFDAGDRTSSNSWDPLAPYDIWLDMNTPNAYMKRCVDYEAVCAFIETLK